MAEQFHAGMGRRRVPSEPLDQANAQPALQAADLLADRGLRQVEPAAAAEKLPRSITSEKVRR
ncbi:MAG: hypothetical protein ACK4QW_16800 [Alphaproteobacteria bacterium]